MRLTRVALAALAGSTLWLSAAAAPANAAVPGNAGWVRLAHFSPNTPAVDVYLYSFKNSNTRIVLHHVGYGMVSPYERVAAGQYSVAMRPAGAAAASPAVLSASVQVMAGHAYTVAGLGPESGLRLAVLSDDLTTPGGKALVRVIQASLRQHMATVTVAADALVTKLAFGAVSSYQAVAAGPASVHVNGTSETAVADVTLAPDTVHTLVVLDGASGLEVVNLTDAAGNTVMPDGGASTGFGGTAQSTARSAAPGGEPAPWLALIAGGVLLALTGGWRLSRTGDRDRARSRA
jgi:hypothetical protein